MSCSCLTSTSALTIFTVYCRETLSASLLKRRNQQFQISGKTWALLHETPPWDQPRKQKFRSSAWALSGQLPWRTVRWSTSWRFFSVQHHVHLKNERRERERKNVRRGFMAHGNTADVHVWMNTAEICRHFHFHKLKTDQPTHNNSDSATSLN